MIKRAMDHLNVKPEALDTSKKINSFKDINKISSEAQGDIEFLLQANIISGKPDGSFDPKSSTTRAQIVKMLHKALEIAKML
jgi:hypothetical protein